MLEGKDKIIEKLNAFGSSKEACFFMLDFEAEKGIVIPQEDCFKEGILYEIKGKINFDLPVSPDESSFNFEAQSIPFEVYDRSFQKIQNEINAGNTYLLNLTFPTKITTNLSLKDIFFRSKAKFKLLYKDQFVVFSPETFVKIVNNKVYSYPMKGTINASVKNAYKKLKESTKEIAEHHTIVDLIRNDLNRVSKKVALEKFRFIEKVKTHDTTLLQVSSRISGILPRGFRKNLGNVLMEMLPAGSVTGAPKKKTIEIIKDAEIYERGFYTGVFGLFDGKNLYSAVMIRFIENVDGHFYFKSGGGITTFSDSNDEYQELIDKIYVPITGNHTGKKRKATKPTSTSTET